jgi:hypothetical protein
MPISSSLGTGNSVLEVLVGRVFPSTLFLIVFREQDCFDKRIKFVQVDITEYGTAHASYNVAKKVVGFEFEERIPRTRLCSAYGDGFKGAPLRCTPQSQDALPRDSNIGDENSISQQPRATGDPHHV